MILWAAFAFCGGLRGLAGGCCHEALGRLLVHRAAEESSAATKAADICGMLQVKTIISENSSAG